MPDKIIRIVLLALLLGFSFASSNVALAASGAGEAAKDGEEKQKSKVRLSQRRFYSLQPFTVPLLDDGEINEQFTIVISLELADENDRMDIAYALPRIRNEMYNELLYLVTFRRKGSTIPQIAIFKRQLLKITQRVTGDKVRALVVQQAFKANTR